MKTELITAFVAFAFVSSITPGPNNLMLMTSGANFGVARSAPHMLGVGIGFAVMILLVGTGVMAVMDAVPATYTFLKIASAAYLVFLAWKIANAAPVTAEAGQSAKTARPLSFLQAAAFQWVNPKAWAMALTAVGAYTIPAEPISSLLFVVLVFGLINLPSIGVWTVMGAQLRRFLADPVKLKVFNLICAALLLATLYPILFGAELKG